MNKNEVLILSLLNAGVLTGVSGLLRFLFANELNALVIMSGFLAPVIGISLIGLAYNLADSDEPSGETK